MQIKLISLTIVEHQDSLQNSNKEQFGNGPLVGTNQLTCKSVYLRWFGLISQSPLNLRVNVSFGRLGVIIFPLFFRFASFQRKPVLEVRAFLEQVMLALWKA